MKGTTHIPSWATAVIRPSQRSKWPRRRKAKASLSRASTVGSPHLPHQRRATRTMSEPIAATWTASSGSSSPQLPKFRPRGTNSEPFGLRRRGPSTRRRGGSSVESYMADPLAYELRSIPRGSSSAPGGRRRWHPVRRRYELAALVGGLDANREKPSIVTEDRDREAGYGVPGDEHLLMLGRQAIFERCPVGGRVGRDHGVVS